MPELSLTLWALVFADVIDRAFLISEVSQDVAVRILAFWLIWMLRDMWTVGQGNRPWIEWKVRVVRLGWYADHVFVWVDYKRLVQEVVVVALWEFKRFMKIGKIDGKAGGVGFFAFLLTTAHSVVFKIIYRLKEPIIFGSITLFL